MVRLFASTPYIGINMLIKYIETNKTKIAFNELQKAMFIDYEAKIKARVAGLKDACKGLTPIANRYFEKFWKKYDELKVGHKDIDEFMDAVNTELTALANNLWGNKYG